MTSKSLYFENKYPPSQNSHRKNSFLCASHYRHCVYSFIFAFCLSVLSFTFSPTHCSPNDDQVALESCNKRQKRTVEEWHEEFDTILEKGIVEAQLDIQDRLHDPIVVNTMGRMLYDYANTMNSNIEIASQSSHSDLQAYPIAIPFPFGKLDIKKIGYTPESRQFTLMLSGIEDGEEHRISRTIILPDLSNPVEAAKFGKIVKALELSALYGYENAVTTLTIMRMMMNSNDEAAKKSLETLSRYTYAEDGSITTSLHNWIQTRQNFVRLFMSDTKARQKEIIGPFFRQFHNSGAWWSQVMHQHMLFTEQSLSFESWKNLMNDFQSLAKDVVMFTKQIFPWFDPHIEEELDEAIQKQTRELQAFLEESARELTSALETGVNEQSMNAAMLLHIQQRISDRAHHAKKSVMAARPIDQWAHSYMDCFSDQARQDQHTCLLMVRLHALTQNLFLSAKLSVENMKITDDLSTHEAVLAQDKAQHDLWETLLDDTALNENMINAHNVEPKLSEPWYEFMRSCFLSSITNGWKILANPLMNTDRDGAPSDNEELEKRLRKKLTVAKSIGNNIPLLYSLLNQVFVKMIQNSGNMQNPDAEFKEIFLKKVADIKSLMNTIQNRQIMLIGPKDENGRLIKSARGRKFTNHFQRLLTERGGEISASDKTLLTELDIVFPEVSS